MKINKILASLLLHVALFMPLINCFAQDYLVDLNLRGATFVILDIKEEGSQGNGVYRGQDGFPVAFNIEGVYFFKPHFGAGAFYSRSVLPGQHYYDGFIENEWQYEEAEFDYSMYGISAEITSGRKRFFQVYGVARLGRAVTVDLFDDYTISNTGLFYSAGLGVRLKISSRVSFNLFDVSYTWLPETFSLYNDLKQEALTANSGFTVRLLRKK